MCANVLAGGSERRQAGCARDRREEEGAMVIVQEVQEAIFQVAQEVTIPADQEVIFPEDQEATILVDQGGGSTKD